MDRDPTIGLATRLFDAQARIAQLKAGLDRVRGIMEVIQERLAECLNRIDMMEEDVATVDWVLAECSRQSPDEPRAEATTPGSCGGDRPLKAIEEMEPTQNTP